MTILRSPDNKVLRTVETSLEITYDNISNCQLADPLDLDGWKTIFVLIGSGYEYQWHFKGVEVVGNKVRLLNGCGLQPNVTYDNGYIIHLVTTHIIRFEDNGCLVSGNLACSQNSPILTYFKSTTMQGASTGLLQNCPLLEEAYLPQISLAWWNSFDNCFALRKLVISNIVYLGGDNPAGDNSLKNIIGNTIEITVPTDLMTANGGAPHATIARLMANNTVTIIAVAKEAYKYPASTILRADPYRAAFIFTVTATTGLSFTLPLAIGAYTHDFWVSWGDGTESYVNAYNSPNATHTYTTAGNYTVKLGGKCQTFSVNNGTMRQYITKVLSWGYCDFRKFDLYGAYVTEVPMTKITGMNNITSFNYFMRGTGLYVGTLSDQWFTETPKVTSFQYAFSGCSAVGDIPEQMYYKCPLVTDFYSLYADAWKLGTGVGATGVMPEKHFWNNPLAIDMSWVWAGTTGITSGLNANQFIKNTKVKYFNGTFGRSALSGAFPEDIFWNNPDVLSFQQLFENARGFTGTIPEKLFRYNTKVTNFGYVFSFGGYVGSSFSGDIPRDLFYYNTEATTFTWCFRWNYSALNIPNGLFRNNLKATDFSLALYRMNNSIMGQYPFSAIDPNIPGDTEAAAAYRRFTGKNMNFNSCFYMDYNGRGNNCRYAPELWDTAIYNMTSNTHNTMTLASPANVYINQASIPVGWK